MTYSICRTRLVSIAPYSQSKHIDDSEFPPKEKEGKDEYDARVWRARMHVNDEGEVYIPAMALKSALQEAAKYLSMQIPGKGKATYTKHFEAGIMVLEDAPTGVMADKVRAEKLYLHANGQRGSGTRVWRRMPRIDSWTADVDWHILDPIITESVFKKVLSEAGNLIGIGRWRPRNGGIYGRFRCESLQWIENAQSEAA